MYKALAPGCIGHGLTFKEAAKAGAAAGFEGYWFSLEADAKTDIGETKELLAETGLRAAGFNLPVEFRTDVATFEDGLKTLGGYAKYAADIGAKRCITWIMPFSETHTFDENFELHRSRLKKCCEIFQDYGILFGLEFVGPPKMRRGKKYDFVYNLDGMLELCNAIGTKNCGLLLDVFHWDMAGQTRADFSKITNEQVALVHINDVPAGVPVLEQEDGDRRLPGETGVLKIADFFDGLKSIRYDGPVLAEPFVKKLSEISYEQALKVVIDSINKVWP